MLIQDLNKAIEQGDSSGAIRICDQILALNFYPPTILRYVQRIKSELQQQPSGPALIPAESSHSRQSHQPLQYASFFETHEQRSLDQSYVQTYAFYLPQFHRVKENDLWWGLGFTEWTNTKNSHPRYPGHYQPREPHNSIGHYNLSDVNIIRSQADLAKSANITGFCFYYYWFSGKRLLETPINILYANPDIDINYVVCWANENWTKKWDGMDHDVLMAQDHRQDWELEFIADVSQYFCDSRYMRIQGKPVLIIYKLNEIPSAREVVAAWRKFCRDSGIGEISIWAVYNVGFNQDELDYIDQFVEFPPRQVGALTKVANDEVKPDEEDSHYYCYSDLVKSMLDKTAIADSLPRPIYRAAMMGWDNSARRRAGFSVWIHYSTELFYDWCRKIWQYTVESFPPGERFLFINAWNEWAEGTYLEPDARFGFTNLNTLSRALSSLPNIKKPHYRLSRSAAHRYGYRASLPSRSEFSPGSDQSAVGKRRSQRIIVHLHLFFLDTLDQIAEHLALINHDFDLLVTVCRPQDSSVAHARFSQLTTIENLWIRCVPNRGRDLGPFVVELSPIIQNYDLVLHIHSKKSQTVWWGDLWRDYLLDHTLGSSQNIEAIISAFAVNHDIGIISPPLYPVMKAHVNWETDAAQRRTQLLLQRCLSPEVQVPPLPCNPHFPSGSFFWARTSAIKPMFEAGITYDEFEPEDSQIQSTLAHAIERSWPYLAGSQCLGYETSLRAPASSPVASGRRRVGIYVYFKHGEHMLAEDVYFVTKLYEALDHLIIVSNSPLTADEAKRLPCHQIIFRENIGYDFGAWKEAILAVGNEFLASFDDCVLVNSSCYGPFVPWANVFAAMAERRCDFWGLSIFPELRHSTRPEAARCLDGIIPRHIQSYFMVFQSHVVSSEPFIDFWNSVSVQQTLLDVTATYEIGLTSHLADAGFQYGAYCEHHEALQDHYSKDPNFNAIYNLPYEMLLLGSPIIKNKLRAIWPGQLQAMKEFLAEATDYPQDLFNAWH